MKRILITFMAFGMLSCNPNRQIKERIKTGNFIGIIKNGNFSDNIGFIIEKDSVSFKVFLTS
ncbi:hypothetical protein F8C76_00675 [Flagellimonas olearia]|uniref:Lipoprotein n=1 Tax=Flagellimonas olearia TaxID=552546 RepID=A0A6I1DXS9_9FLAO|nr:hypothetical protein [Allomuricauda olearia]KAB7530068.1 hypothetical protein F8C76_00675 [Allomuricauda olearia]